MAHKTSLTRDRSSLQLWEHSAKVSPWFVSLCGPDSVSLRKLLPEVQIAERLSTPTSGAKISGFCGIWSPDTPSWSLLWMVTEMGVKSAQNMRDGREFMHLSYKRSARSFDRDLKHALCIYTNIFILYIYVHIYFSLFYSYIYILLYVYYMVYPYILYPVYYHMYIPYLLTSSIVPTFTVFPLFLSISYIRWFIYHPIFSI